MISVLKAKVENQYINIECRFYIIQTVNKIQM